MPNEIQPTKVSKPPNISRSGSVIAAETRTTSATSFKGKKIDFHEVLPDQKQNVVLCRLLKMWHSAASFVRGLFAIKSNHEETRKAAMEKAGSKIQLQGKSITETSAGRPKGVVVKKETVSMEYKSGALKKAAAAVEPESFSKQETKEQAFENATLKGDKPYLKREDLGEFNITDYAKSDLEDYKQTLEVKIDKINDDKAKTATMARIEQFERAVEMAVKLKTKHPTWSMDQINEEVWKEINKDKLQMLLNKQSLGQ